MKVRLHQDVEGHKANDEIDVSEDRAEWLVKQGYASIEGDDSDKTLVTDVTADKDPTLAANQPADDPGAGGLNAPQDKVARGEDVEAHEVFANMVEDPETGESVSIDPRVSMQSIGNTEAKSSQAQADLAAGGRRAGDEGTALSDSAKTDASMTAAEQRANEAKTGTTPVSGSTQGSQAQASTTKDAGRDKGGAK